MPVSNFGCDYETKNM